MTISLFLWHKCSSEVKMSTFKDTKLRDDIKEIIASKFGFINQTLIQERTIPAILAGQDVLGQSETGSGKTLAFGVGVIERVVRGQGVQALIITPTRELAEQVREYICKLVDNKLRVISIYGGVSINPQIDGLKDAEVVIATPGRLKDHMQRETISLRNVKILVLDEADRMLDMGFIEDIEDIISQCPRERQTLFFSATMPPAIQDLSHKYMKNQVTISASKHVDHSKLEQVYYDVDKSTKFSLLVHLLNEETSSLIIVFCNTRRSTDMVVKNLCSNGIDAIALHGGHTQNKRTRAMDDFKKGKKQVLVCTDVAARGIHIEDISHIYNYELPKDPTDYVHRIGRTARAGCRGKVINLLCDLDHGNFSRIFEEYGGSTIKKMQRPQFKKIFFKSTKNRPRPGNSRRQGFGQGRRYN
jgi:ATP-dependent RNA helicase DeaD